MLIMRATTGESHHSAMTGRANQMPVRLKYKTQALASTATTDALRSGHRK